MKNLLLSLLLLLSLSSEALADRGRLNRFGTLTVERAIFPAGTAAAPSIAIGRINDGWYSSANGVIDASANGVTILKIFDGQTRFQAGSSNFPGIAGLGDTNTGISWPAADQLGVSVGGSTVATFSSTGLATGLSVFAVNASTADGADSAATCIAGGGACAAGRGGYIVLQGEEVSGGEGGRNGGDIIYTAGPGDTHSFVVDSSAVVSIDSGSLDVTGEISISGASTSTGVLCTKSNGDIGQCTSLVGAGGTCTCA